MSRYDERPCDTFGEPGCGCCEGIAPKTSASTPNRPGLPALQYRIGQHADFLDTMKARLSSWTLVRQSDEVAAGTTGGGERAADRTNPLLDLRTRAGDDAAIAMLDGWATVADVLTFYQERIANEGFLRTATERRSIVELARLIGYRPRPGVASSLYLAYTIDENTKEEVVIPEGAKSQSIPGPDELPQIFETSEPLAARAAWNRLTPRKSHPPTWESIWSPAGSTLMPESQLRLYVKGVSSNIKVGDPLLITGVPGEPQLYRAIEVEVDPPEDRTRLELSPWAGPSASDVEAQAVMAAIADLKEAGPTAESGTNAAEVHALLDMISGNIEAGGLSSTVANVIAGSSGLPAIHAKLEQFNVANAPNLAPWLESVEVFLEALLHSIDPGLAAPDGAAVSAADVERVKRLAKTPPAPLPTAARLPRTLKGNFSEKSDAAFKAVGSVRPDLRETLPAAWANYAGATTPPKIKVYALRVKAGLFGHNFPMKSHAVTRDNVTGFAGGIESGLSSVTDGESTTIEVIGEWPIVIPTGGNGTFHATESPDVIYLDASYEGILPESWIVLDFAALRDDVASDERQVIPSTANLGGDVIPIGDTFVTRVRAVNPKISRAEYGGSGDTTRVQLADDWISIRLIDTQDTTGLLLQSERQNLNNNDFEIIRATSVFAQSEELELAEQPIVAPICYEAHPGEYIELDGLYADLEPGRFVVVSGERTDIPETTGVEVSEAAMIIDVIHDVRSSSNGGPLSSQAPNEEATPTALPGDRIHTFLRLDKPLAFCYKRDAVTIHANVVKATHGETKEEVLGSGDGSKAFAAFELKQKPLTYVPAATPDGIESTLDVFVDNIRWKQVPDFTQRGPREHIYSTRTDNEARTTVIFGDGHAGARPPTGVENIRAVYRSGIGKAGNVRARQVSLLSTRPLGVKEVINPLRASGGADRDTRDQARNNAPLAVKSLDRLVSVADYADFARTFAGIGKALAAELSDGQRTVVHVTIAGADDIPIDRGSDLFINLQRALRDFGDPFQPVALDVREMLLLVIEARIRILEDHQWEVVVADVRSRLLEAFGFERRQLGQDVARSEIIAVMQSVRGVDWVDLDVFGTVATTRPDQDSPNGRRLATPDEIGEDVRALVGAQQNTAPEHRAPVRVAALSAKGILPAQIALLAADVPATLALNQIP